MLLVFSTVAMFAAVCKVLSYCIVVAPNFKSGNKFASGSEISSVVSQVELC